MNNPCRLTSACRRTQQSCTADARRNVQIKFAYLMKQQNFNHSFLFQNLSRFLIANLLLVSAAVADSSSPRLAAYYDSFLAICGDKVYEWSDSDTPQQKMTGVKQVGVGKDRRYGLTHEGNLIHWSKNSPEVSMLMDDVKTFHAGRSGVFVIRNNDSLWKFKAESLFGIEEKISDTPTPIDDEILTAAIGDSANYYVSKNGALFVLGKAHRGQYGDGKLTSTERFTQTSDDVVQVVSHTGHALLLKNNGSVWGTGGNIYGPLGSHGYGDKAIRWGIIFEGASAIATGSSHSHAIKPDGSLWIWGREEGLEPKKVMTNVTSVAAGNSSTIAISNDALWQWDTGDKPKVIMKCP